MKLKALELEGFKSFAEKTVLRFDKSITGVVGPNGCGKSNVVDAIRWVMGEQSAKHLRGKNMEDVIFVGAKDRGPSAVASVELTFSTDGTQTPVQYTDSPEISIARKLFRTGESEYYINRQVVRLKDVRELFLGTGVGVNAYSIIEQGQIGAIVTAKPEDRRRIVEEAAGISKFQIRKEAALRRMEATEQNLLRLKDVLTELERQKNSLERQAKKAEKFRTIRDELKTIDLRVASIDFEKLTDREKGALQKLKTLDESLVQAQAALQEQENLYETKRLQSSEFEQTVNDLQQAAYELDNVLGISESRLANRKEERERFFGLRQKEETRHHDLSEKIQDLKQELDLSIEKAVQTDFESEAQKKKLEGAESVFQKIQKASQALFETLARSREKQTESAKEVIRLSTQKGVLKNRLEELSQRKVCLSQDLEKTARKYEELTRDIKAVQKGLTDTKQLKFSMDEKQGDILAQLKQFQEKIQNQKTELESCKEELLTKKSRLKSLQELEKNFEGYRDGPKSFLEKKRAGEANYILGAVAEFIEVKPQYENAVSAVLGEKTQCLVVTEPAESVSGAQLAKSLGTGRSSFVALQNSFFEDATLNERVVVSQAPQVRGSLGFLKEHVRFKEGYEKLKNILIEDYILVEGLEHALEIWQNFRQPVVTCDGEIITQEGILTGGNVERTSKALFEKKREMQGLEIQIQELITIVKEKEEACFDLDHALRSLQADLEGMRKTSQEEEIKMTSREKDVEALQKEAQTLAEGRHNLSSELLKIDEDSCSTEKTLSELETREIAHCQIQKEADQEISEKNAEELRFQEDLKTRQEAVTEAKIGFAQIISRQEELEKTIERLSENLSGLRKEVFQLEEHISFLKKREIFCTDRIRFQEKNISRLLKKKTKSDEAYQKQKREFEALHHDLMQVEITLKDLRQKQSKAKDELNEHTLGLSEIRNHLSRLKEQTFERYHLSLTDIYQDHLNIPKGFVYEEAMARAESLRERLGNVGSINLEAIDELKDISERFEFLNQQRIDLENSLTSLTKAIEKINETTRVRFKDTFELINEKFSQLFPRLFQGGEAYLQLTDPENILETGVDIIAQPPGKRLQSISLLSGGEKALTAVSLLFAIFLIKPSPFCLLDEVDAPLDDANVDRYNEIIHEMSQRTQFVVITHNKRTMQKTDVLFGVTMEKTGISQLVSVSLD